MNVNGPNPFRVIDTQNNLSNVNKTGSASNADKVEASKVEVRRPYINREGVKNLDTSDAQKVLSKDEEQLFALLFPAGKPVQSKGILRSYDVQNTHTREQSSSQRSPLGKNLDITA